MRKDGLKDQLSPIAPGLTGDNQNSNFKTSALLRPFKDSHQSQRTIENSKNASSAAGAMPAIQKNSGKTKSHSGPQNELSNLQVRVSSRHRKKSSQLLGLKFCIDHFEDVEEEPHAKKKVKER